jgi:hypothetical protein
MYLKSRFADFWAKLQNNNDPEKPKNHVKNNNVISGFHHVEVLSIHTNKKFLNFSVGLLLKSQQLYLKINKSVEIRFSLKVCRSFTEEISRFDRMAKAGIWQPMGVGLSLAFYKFFLTLKLLIFQLFHLNLLKSQFLHTFEFCKMRWLDMYVQFIVFPWIAPTKNCKKKHISVSLLCVSLNTNILSARSMYYMCTKAQVIIVITIIRSIDHLKVIK